MSCHHCLRCSELCDIVCYSVGISHQKMDTLNKGMIICNTQVGCGIQIAKKISPTPLYHHHQPEHLIQGMMHTCIYLLFTKF